MQDKLQELRTQALAAIEREDSLATNIAEYSRTDFKAVREEDWFIREVMKELLWIDSKYDELLAEVY